MMLMKKVIFKLNFIVLIVFITIASNTKSEEINCSSINSKSYEIINTSAGIKYCFNAGKFLIINKESKNQVFAYNFDKFKNSYLHSFGEIKSEEIKKFDKEFAEISPHVIYFTDEGTLHTNLIYNHYHQENLDNTRVVVRESPYDTNQVIEHLSNNIDAYCEGEQNSPLIKASYIILECEIVNQKNEKIIVLKLNAKYNYEKGQETKKSIQSLLSDFQITDFKTNMTRYDVYYSFKNKNYLFNVVSTCNEYMPKRSCEDEKQQLNNLINNLIFY